MNNILPFAYAGDGGSPGWKRDADGKIVEKDGNPVYLDSKGAEMTVGSDTISNLNKESQKFRTERDEAEKKLKAFDGLDPKVAKDAIAKLKDIDLSKLVDAGKLDEVKRQITDEFTKQLTEKDGALTAARGEIDNMKINGVFANSEFVRDSIAVPRDMFEASFRNNFKVENGKVTAYDKAGNRIMSKQKVGEFAEPEEALTLLVDQHAQKDIILKANTGSGSGNNGAGGQRPGSRIVRRSEMEKMLPTQQAEISAKVRTGEIQLTD